MRLSWVSAFVAVVGCSSDPTSGAAVSSSSSSSSGGPSSPRDAAADAPDAETDGGPSDAGADVVYPPCLDDQATPDGGSDCTANGCSTVCANIHAHFKTGVAQAATTCIAKLDSCTNVEDVFPCVDVAMSHACGDPTAKSACTPYAQQCDPGGMAFDQSSCEAFLNGMSANGRQVFGQCVTTAIDAGTCADQIANCANDIRH